ncbi:MAG: ribonuclease P protein component [Bacteroidales bacterium]|nr:ribonuclease P protein component [Bacteroidales bacterium]
MSQTLPKAERLSGTASVSALFGHGKGFSHGSLRCKVLPRQDSVMPGPSSVMPDPDRASALPASEENYFLEQCPKNQFSSGIASPSRADASRIVVSVPKRLFKRAVKRNLLKRRIREAYRRQKGLLSAPVDILFIYAAPEVLPYDVIFADMTAILTAVSASVGAQVPDN